jgi:transcriptional antiterminator
MRMRSSEDEVGYFALHMEVALNQKDKEIKKNILLVCATGEEAHSF